jgi:hypothetical protein
LFSIGVSVLRSDADERTVVSKQVDEAPIRNRRHGEPSHGPQGTAHSQRVALSNPHIRKVCSASARPKYGDALMGGQSSTISG